MFEGCQPDFRAALRRLVVGGIAAAALCAVLSVMGSAAQGAEQTEAQLRSQQQTLFNQLQAQPDNLDVMFDYAVVSIRLRDYEQAIATLERILIYRDDLPQVKLELGSAYFRLGSYEVARFYFNEVMEGNPPPELAGRVQEFLAEIDRRTQESRFSGSVYFGGVYSTNANLGPSGRGVDVFGLDAELDPEFVEADDFGLRAGANLIHRYDLGRPNTDAWITQAAIATLHYFSETAGDLDVFVAKTGPKLGLSDETDGARIRPFVDGTYIRSDNDFLFFGLGGGAEFENPIDGDTLFFAKAGASYRDYNRTNNDSDGFTYYAESGLQARYDGDTVLRGSLFGVYDDTQEGYTSNVELGLRVNAVHNYLSGAGFAGNRPWSITAFGTLARRWYDDADPAVDPDKDRRDLDLRVGLGHIFRIEDGWALSLDASYFDRGSNIRNFRLDNFELGATVSRSF